MTVSFKREGSGASGSNEESSRASLFRSEEGAIMLPGIFMTLFVVALLYALIGIGRTIAMQEGMQDAADASAFSAAIFHARGMNLIAFLNILMMILVSILVVIRLAQTLMIMAAVGLSIASVFSFGAAAPLVPVATNAATTLGNIYKEVKAIVFPVLEGLHALQRATSVVVPWVALADGMIEASKHHPPAKGALALPGALSLPVEPDEFSVLCDRAIAEIVEVVLSTALGPFGEEPPDILNDLVEKPIDALLVPTSSYLCGDGKQAPPTQEETYEAYGPRQEGLTDCETDRKSPTCLEAVEFSDAAAPHEDTGQCLRDCRPDGPYELQARDAREACNPEHNRDISEYLWQRREGTGRFRYQEGHWKLVQLLDEDVLKTETTDTPPCGRGGTLSEEWNDSGELMQAEPDALCTTGFPYRRVAPHEGEEITTEFKQATRIFSCSEKVKRSYPVADKEDSLGGDDEEKRSPHKIEDDLELGSETFQIRAIAFGDKPGPGNAKKFVEIVDRKTEGESDGIEAGIRTLVEGAANVVGRFSAAQAEYYFDHDGDEQPSEWMWNMYWTARLKHFRLPSQEEEDKENDRQKDSEERTQDNAEEFAGGSDKQTAEGSCRNAGGPDCEQTSGRASFFDGWIRH